jgi:general secretion pathway protein A
VTMYLDYYSLKLKPFEISPDPKFLWLGEKHNEAFATLEYGISENKGFVSLTGEAGTGKTTIVNALANSLGDNIIFAQISDPSLEELDFFNMTANVFEMNKKFRTKGDFLIHLEHFLNNAYANNKEVVLIIEEAQSLDQELLEQIRLLSNIEKQDKKLITIIFVGQKEFNNILKKNEALRQRITIIYNIKPLLDYETEKYIMHRLKVAGSEKQIFSPSAIREIFSFSEGNPRLINIICDLALLTGYAKELKIIEPEIIRECAVNFQLSNQPGKDESEKEKALANTIHKNIANKVQSKTARRKIAYLASAVLIVLACVFGYFYYFGGYNTSSMNIKTFLEKALGRFTDSKSETSIQKSDEIAILQGDTAKSKVKPLDFNAPKAAEVILRGQLKTRNEELDAALKELKSTKERVTELESEVATREQMLLRSEKKLTELTKELEQEKKSKELLQAELSSKVASVAEPQEKLDDMITKAILSAIQVDNQTAKLTSSEDIFFLPERKTIIQFGHDSMKLPDEAHEVLDQIVKFSSSNPVSEIIVEGYTDSLGDYIYNKNISKSRADVIKKYLVDKGIPATKIETFGMGPENPIANNETFEGRKLNRRIEIRIKVK